MSQSKWTKGLVVSTIFALFAGVVGLLASGNSEADTTAAESSEISQEVIDLLTVSTVSDDARCVVDDSGFTAIEIGALEGMPPRQQSDSLSTPVQATEPEPARDEIQQEGVCKDPLTGVTYLVFLATDVRQELLEKTGVDIVELNEDWLKPFAVDPSEINSIAAEFVPLRDVNPSFKEGCDVDEANPSACWTDEYRQLVNTAIAKNREWQELAAKLNTLLDRFAVTIGAPQSIVNYHLAIGGLVAGLPAVERNPNQEDLPALVLSLTEKDQCKPLLMIGFNLGDKRPELFGVPECESPTPPTDEEAPPTTGEQPPTTTEKPPRSTTTQPPCDCPTTTKPPTTTPPTTKPPSTTTTTIPEEGKDHTRSPVSDDLDDPDEVTRPNIPAPPEVIRPPGSTTTQPPPPVTVPTPTTVAPAPAPPTTSAPTTNPPPPPPGSF